MRTFAFFDLDGTITRADTMLEFLAFAKGRARLYLFLARVFPAWCLAKLKVFPADAPKRALVRMVFAGQPTARWQQLAGRFCRERMPLLLRPGAMDCIGRHQEQGHEVVIVTASCALWVADWCSEHGLGLIATGLETVDGSYTGKLSTPNCKGAEKVRRIHADFGLLRDAHVYAYGDTPGDKPMLALAMEPHYKPFR